MTKVGRNEPCPCGSGLKYKNCCAGKKRETPRWQIALWVALALVVAFATLSWLRDMREAPDGPTCPAGQVWSAEHGHCH